MRSRILGLAIAVAISAPAQAHKLKVFATAAGSDITGYGYFVPGGRAQDSDVIVSRADGSVVARLKTDDRGEFHFQAKTAEDLSFLVDAGDGHEASYRVAASEVGAPVAPASVEPVAPSARAEAGPQAPLAVDISPIIEQAVARQLRPLREQIDGWQEKIWLHDVLGGIGYIIGLAGLLYGLTGTRRAREADDALRQVKDARR